MASENENPAALLHEVLWGVGKKELKVDAIYLDFQKTSVKVLSSYKFGGNVIL